MSSPADFLGWDLPSGRAEAPSEAGAVSFNLGSGAPPAASDQQVARWSVDLPADPHQAAQALHAAEARAYAFQAALEQASLHLDDLSYQAVEAAPLPGSVSFSISGPLAGRAVQELQGWLRGLARMLTVQAWVETSQQGSPLGRTVVTWTGDMKTEWSAAPAAAEQVELHLRSLNTALLSRAALVRMAGLIFQTAGRAAAVAAFPGSALWALPGAWKAVSQLMAEFEKLKNLQK